MKTAEEREIDRLNEGRILREASFNLLPLLRTMRDGAIAKITNAHKESGPNCEHTLRGAAAELSVLADLIAKLERNNKETEAKERKLL